MAALYSGDAKTPWEKLQEKKISESYLELVQQSKILGQSNLGSLQKTEAELISGLKEKFFIQIKNGGRKEFILKGFEDTDSLDFVKLRTSYYFFNIVGHMLMADIDHETFIICVKGILNLLTKFQGMKAQKDGVPKSKQNFEFYEVSFIKSSMSVLLQCLKLHPESTEILQSQEFFDVLYFLIAKDSSYKMNRATYQGIEKLLAEDKSSNSGNLNLFFAKKCLDQISGLIGIKKDRLRQDFQFIFKLTNKQVSNYCEIVPEFAKDQMIGLGKQLLNEI